MIVLGTAPLVPFAPLIATQLGLSEFKIGIIYGVLPFIGLIAKTGFGAIADKCRCRKLILLFSIICIPT